MHLYLSIGINLPLSLSGTFWDNRRCLLEITTKDNSSTTKWLVRWFNIMNQQLTSSQIIRLVWESNWPKWEFLDCVCRLNAISPALFPVSSFTFKNLDVHLVRIAFVPLHTPADWSRLCDIIVRSMLRQQPLPRPRARWQEDKTSLGPTCWTEDTRGVEPWWSY